MLVDFYIIPRKGYYYLRFFNVETQEVLTEKSAHILARLLGMRFTGKVSPQNRRIVEKIGIQYVEKLSGVKSAETTKLIPFVLDYWDYNGERLTKERELNGRSTTKRTSVNKINQFKKHIMPYFTETDTLTDCTPEKLEVLQRALIRKGLSRSSINEILHSLEVPLRYAKKKGLLAEVPYVQPLKITDVHEKGILTADEISLIFENINDVKHKKIILIGALTGMRISEVIALKQSSFTFSGDICSVEISESYSEIDGFKSPKNGKPRTTVIPATVARYVLSGAKTERFLFCSKESIRKELNQAMNKVGIDYKTRNLTFHSFRHSFISNIRTNLDDSILQRTVGHSSLQMTEHYTHLTDENMIAQEQATEKVFQSVIQSLVSGKSDNV